jgi:hypothetical protein
VGVASHSNLGRQMSGLGKRTSRVYKYTSRIDAGGALDLTIAQRNHGGRSAQLESWISGVLSNSKFAKEFAANVTNFGFGTRGDPGGHRIGH